jgi:hypothetical protein
MQVKKSTPKIKKTEKFIYLDIYSGKAKVKRPDKVWTKWRLAPRFKFKIISDALDGPAKSLHISLNR